MRVKTETPATLAGNAYANCSRCFSIVDGCATGMDYQPHLTMVLAILTLVAGCCQQRSPTSAVNRRYRRIGFSVRFVERVAPGYLGLEAVAIAGLSGNTAGLSICQSPLRVLLGQRVLILEKALTLDWLTSRTGVYDKMTRARREASSRPLSLVSRTFKLVQDGLSPTTYGGLLLLSLAVVLVLAAVPAFVAETRFAGSLPLIRWRAPETREQNYLETLIARKTTPRRFSLTN